MRDKDLSIEEAHMVLEPYFLVSREIFVGYCTDQGLGDAISRTSMECRKDMHDSERHFAGATVDGRKICVAPQMAELPEDTVAAIFAHEFGHIVDHLYPGRYFIVQDELVIMSAEVPDDRRGDQTRVARMKQWETRSDDDIELVADLLAEQATGCRIGYSGKCLLQGLNRGVRRPAGLR